MIMKYFLIILVFLIILLSIYTISVYNKLKVDKNEVDKIWNRMRLAIEEQFKLVEANINLVEDKDPLVNLINSYNLMAYIEDVMEAYLSLEKMIYVLGDNNFKHTFMERDKAINDAKVLYNDVLLRYNNTVSMIPGSYVAKIFGFHSGIWFRNID